MNRKPEKRRALPRPIPELGRTVASGDRLIALFFFGSVLFNPLLVNVFDRGPELSIGGVPFLFLYLFIGWGLVIVFAALVIERRSKRRGGHEPDPSGPASGP